MATLEFRDISMHFGSKLVLDSVSFPVAAGRVHAILGENGAGKSTLMKILAGELKSTGGGVSLDGEERSYSSPLEAKQAGIRFVHQHLSLIPALSIVENFVLESSAEEKPPKIANLAEDMKAAAVEFGLEIDPHRKVGDLSMSERQWLEVFRAIFFGGRILILDEPTALLSPIEGDRQLSKARDLARQGRTVILITHKLREILEFADVVTVLRKGLCVGTYPVEEMDPETLAALMVDKDEAVGLPEFESFVLKEGVALVRTQEVTVRDVRKVEVLSKVSLAVYRGEVHGIAGVAGNGQTELVEMFAGLRSPTVGRIEHQIDTFPVVRYVPAARTTEGTSSLLTILENLVLRAFDSGRYSMHGLVDWNGLREMGTGMVEDLRIKIGGLDDSPATLSGGNLQRLVLAREMAGDIDLLIVHNPTSGIDLPSSIFVRERLRMAASSGVGILLVSDDLDELTQISDRISVLHSGKIVGDLTRSEFSRERIGAMMTGHHNPRNRTTLS